MITKKMIQDGLNEGLIKLIAEPDFTEGTVCKIGEYWFYFGGYTAEELLPEEYKQNVPFEEIIEEIFSALCDLCDLADKNERASSEYDYYEAFLLDNLKDPPVRTEFSTPVSLQTPIGKFTAEVEKDADGREIMNIYVTGESGLKAKLAEFASDSSGVTVSAHIWATANKADVAHVQEWAKDDMDPI